MYHVKWFFNAVNYGFYCLYSFTIIDVVKKVTFDEFYLSNATNFVQFILTLIGVIFAYFRLKTYIRDAKVKSEILEQDLIAKRQANFYHKWDEEFIDPFKEKQL